MNDAPVVESSQSSTPVAESNELKSLVVGKETLRRLKNKSSLKANYRTQTSICSMCTP